MPDQSLNLAALRGAHKASYYVTAILGDLVYSATVSSATAKAIAITGGSGAIGDVQRGMRIVIQSSGGVYKGTLSVRYSGSITTGSIPIRETSSGGVQIGANDLVKIYRDMIPTDKLVEDDAAFAPDGLAVGTLNTDPAPLISSGSWDAGRVDSGLTYRTIYTNGGETIGVDINGSTLVHTWTALTSGLSFAPGSASTDSSPTLRATVGFQMMEHKVENTDTGAIDYQYPHYYVHDSTNTPRECVLTSVDGDQTSGFRATFELFESATLDDLPDGCAVIIWADETLNGVARAYGASLSDRSHILMLGFLRRDTARASGETGAAQVEFEVISPLAKLGELPGFSKVLINDAAPDAWSEIYSLSVSRAIIQILRYYTNITALFDLSFPLFSDRDYPAFYLNKSTPLELVRELADGVDTRIICDRVGRLEIQRRLELLPLDERNVPTTTITLTTTDIIDYECTREHWRPVETFRARGFVKGHQNNTPLFARWPGTPGTGTSSGVSEKLIADNAADLQERCALRGAFEDRVYVDANGLQKHAPTLRLTLFGAYARIFQFFAEWIAFDGVTTMRGVDLSDFRWILQTVSEGFDGNGSATTTVMLIAETAGTGAVDDTPAAESYAPTDPGITFPPILTTNPILDADGLSALTDTLAVFDATNKKVHIVTGFRSVLSGGTPSATGYALSLTGSLASFTYIAGSSVNGVVATTEEVRSISDIFGARTLGTAQAYTATNQAQVQLQSERGDPDNVVVMIYRDTGGSAAYYSTDAGATWTASTGLTAYYDTNYTNNTPNWANGVYIDPRGNGVILTSCHTSTASPPGSAFYRSTDSGATFALYNPSGYTIDGYNARCIVRPLNRPDDVVFFGSLTSSNARLIRVIGSTRTDISPSTGGKTYGVTYTAAQRAFSVADGDPNAGVLIGIDTTAAGGFRGVFQTFNALATTPTWNVIVTPALATGIDWRGAYYVDRNTIYLYGAGGALGIAKYSGGAWGLYSTTISGCGEIVGICGG